MTWHVLLYACYACKLHSAGCVKERLIYHLVSLTVQVSKRFSCGEGHWTKNLARVALERTLYIGAIWQNATGSFRYFKDTVVLVKTDQRWSSLRDHLKVICTGRFLSVQLVQLSVKSDHRSCRACSICTPLHEMISQIKKFLHHDLHK